MPESTVPPGLAYLADNIITKDNILGASKTKSAEWAKGLNLPAEGDTLFFAGCGYQYSGDMESMMGLLRKIDKSAISTEWTMGVAGMQKKLGIDAAGIYRKLFSRGSDENPLRDAVKVLQALGIKPAYLGEQEPCCGAPLYFSGLEKQFASRTADIYKRVTAHGAKEIISIVPSCTYGLKNLLPKYVSEDKLKVKHFCEVVAEKSTSLKMKYPQKVKVTYHDSCQLVRYLGLVKEPRQILNSIENIEFVEPKWTKGEWATCCGGGGGFEVVFPELSLILAKNRAKELAETGAEIIVTHCPGCIMQIESGLKELKLDNIKVMDLAQIAATALGVK
jgi:dimethylglycine catabolism B